METSAAPSSLPPVAHLGGYRIVRSLPGGRGYLALAESGREVVIKPLDPACLVRNDLHPDIRERLNRVRELAVPGVVNLIAVERDGGCSHAIWEWRAGHCLADWLATTTSRAQRLHVARELVLLVESLHAAGIVHGALHVGNVIRDPVGKLWLTHVSPLLMTDFTLDIEATAAVLRQMLGHDAPTSTTLRQMRLALVDLIESTSLNEIVQTVDGEGRLRAWSIMAAIACALLAGAASFAIWTWVRR